MTFKCHDCKDTGVIHLLTSSKPCACRGTNLQPTMSEAAALWRTPLAGEQPYHFKGTPEMPVLGGGGGSLSQGRASVRAMVRTSDGKKAGTCQVLGCLGVATDINPLYCLKHIGSGAAAKCDHTQTYTLEIKDSSGTTTLTGLTASQVEDVQLMQKQGMNGLQIRDCLNRGYERVNVEEQGKPSSVRIVSRHGFEEAALREEAKKIAVEIHSCNPSLKTWTDIICRALVRLSVRKVIANAPRFSVNTGGRVFGKTEAMRKIMDGFRDTYPGFAKLAAQGIRDVREKTAELMCGPNVQDFHHEIETEAGSGTMRHTVTFTVSNPRPKLPNFGGFPEIMDKERLDELKSKCNALTFRNEELFGNFPAIPNDRFIRGPVRCVFDGTKWREDEQPE
ncbi:MAG: hypothetical protein IT435_02585 [Phycisphaerales bacterium]|nr:hypothetical protein [Phycisphaerales bacterium]